jgi:hypothetical protein
LAPKYWCVSVCGPPAYSSHETADDPAKPRKINHQPSFERKTNFSLMLKGIMFRKRSATNLMCYMWNVKRDIIEGQSNDHSESIAAKTPF